MKDYSVFDVFNSLEYVVNIGLYEMLQDYAKKAYIFIENQYVEKIFDIVGGRIDLSKYVFSYYKQEVQDNIEFFKKIPQQKDIKTLNENTIFLLIGSSYCTEIYRELKSMGFKNFYTYDVSTFGNLWRYSILLKSKKQINDMFNSLEDMDSKKVIENILKAKITNNYVFIDKVQDKNFRNEYFDDKIVPLTDDETFIDAGAYFGDTLIKFMKNVNFSFNNIYLFEPDKNNFYMLENQIQNNILLSFQEGKVEEFDIHKVRDKIHYYNLGVYNEKTTLSFSGSIGVASHITGNIKMNDKIDEKYKTSIDSIKLDDFITDSKVSIIKMDIEGAEIEALKGCRSIITQQRPKLIICIYHKEDHLWKIPLYMADCQAKCNTSSVKGS